jgi:hypothetical protein
MTADPAMRSESKILLDTSQLHFGSSVRCLFTSQPEAIIALVLQKPHRYEQRAGQNQSSQKNDLPKRHSWTGKGSRKSGHEHHITGGSNRTLKDVRRREFGHFTRIHISKLCLTPNPKYI